jgi:protein CLEC16A
MVLCHYLFYLLQVEDIRQILVISYICGTWQQYLFDYAVSDDMVFQFITTPPVSTYFSDLVCRLKEQCFHLDTLLHSKEEKSTRERRNELILETDKILDDLYYLKDILSVGEYHLSRLISQNLFSLLVFPTLLPLLQLTQSDVRYLPLNSFSAYYFSV